MEKTVANVKPYALSLSFADIDNEYKSYDYFISLHPDKILNEIYNIVDTMDFPKESEYELRNQVFAHIGAQMLLEENEDTDVFFCAGESGHYFLTIKTLYRSIEE